MSGPGERSVVIVDRMGNLSFELLLWMASDFCTEMELPALLETIAFAVEVNYGSFSEGPRANDANSG